MAVTRQAASRHREQFETGRLYAHELSIAFRHPGRRTVELAHLRGSFSHDASLSHRPLLGFEIARVNVRAGGERSDGI